MKKPTILVVQGGFYYFGDEVASPQPGYVCITAGSMFGGFSGGKGLPGVARGDASAKVTLDRFEPSSVLTFPESAVLGILPCIDLYEFKGTTLR